MQSETLVKSRSSGNLTTFKSAYGWVQVPYAP